MKIKLLSKDAKIPARAENGAAGYDLYVPNDVQINPGRNMIPLDIQIELPAHTEGFIRPRSGFSKNGMEGYALDNLNEPKRFDADTLPGTIDESYRGNVGVLLKSYETEPFIIKKGTRIAQMVVSYYINDTFEEVSELSDTDRGVNGFGFTGIM
jgi:dUTP pyrophosphatase